jgi:hypothetical protein
MPRVRQEGRRGDERETSPSSFGLSVGKGCSHLPLFRWLVLGCGSRDIQSAASAPSLVFLGGCSHNRLPSEWYRFTYCFRLFLGIPWIQTGRANLGLPLSVFMGDLLGLVDCVSSSRVTFLYENMP